MAMRDRVVTFDTKDEWLEFKRGTISATDAIAISGLRYFGRTPASVYFDKTCGPGDDQASRAMARGTAMEPYLVAAYAEDQEVILEPMPRWWCVRHPTIPWLTCSPDGLIAPMAKCIEAKTSRRYVGWDDPDDVPDGVPFAYVVQCAIQMSCCDLDECDLVACVGSLDDFRVYRLQRNERLERALIERVTRFREEHILPGVVPEWDGSEAADRLLAELHPFNKVRDQLVEVVEGIPEYEHIRELANCQREADAAARELARRRQVVQADIGDGAGFVTADGARVTWRCAKNGSRPFRATFDTSFPPTE